MKYDAFISYRHLERDMYVAKKVHKALETTKIPRKIQKEIGRKRINRVFRDQEELPIGSDLGSNIEAALQEAGMLIVICSPQTKDSYWVMKEIDTFIAMHGRENVLAVLVDGEPGDSFPPQLLVDEAGNPVEPLAADVRGSSKREVRRKLKTESLRLAASILNVDYDDLKQRHRERRIKKIAGIAIGITTIIAGLGIAFGLYNAYNLQKINEEYTQKLINESKVLAATSLDVLDSGDRQAAALIALAGLPTEENERPVVPESIYALSQALDCYDIGADLAKDKILVHNLPVTDFVENIQGTRVLSYDTSDYVYLWDLESGEKLFEIPPEYDNYGTTVSNKALGFSESNAVVINANGIFAYNESGEEVYSFIPEGYVKGGEIYSKSGKAILCTDTNVYLIDAESGEILKDYANHTDIDFGHYCALDAENNKMAVTHYDIGDMDINYCTIYDLNTDEYVDVPMAGDTCMDLIFDDDGQLLLGTMDYDGLMSFSDAPLYVQRIDSTTGQELWNREFVYEGASLSSSYSYIRTTKVELNGEECGRVIINGTKSVFELDLYTGEDINIINSDSYIQRIGFNDIGTYIFVGTSDGKVTLYHTDPAITLTDNIMDITDDSMMDFFITSGTLVARTYRSSELLVQKYSTDESMLYEVDLDAKVSAIVDSSPSGDLYLVAEHYDGADDSYGYMYDVVETASGEIKNHFEVEKADYKSTRFISEDKIVIPRTDGCIDTYNISKSKLDEEKYYDCYTAEASYSQNGKYLIYYNGSDYTVVSLSDMKTLKDGSNESGPISSAIVTNDGETVYCIDSLEYTLKRFSTSKDKVETLVPDYRVDIIGLSDDATLVAAACDDGKLRVYKTDSMELVDEIPFYVKSYSGFVKFSNDNSKLYLQGADLYFRIYDLEQNKFVYKNKYQTNEYDFCEYDEENNRLILSNFIAMTIIDLDSMGELSYISGGRIYIPENKTIICVDNLSLYAFKFKELDELMAQAEELYGDMELTDEQKLEYHIE